MSHYDYPYDAPVTSSSRQDKLPVEKKVFQERLDPEDNDVISQRILLRLGYLDD